MTARSAEDRPTAAELRGRLSGAGRWSPVVASPQGIPPPGARGLAPFASPVRAWRSRSSRRLDADIADAPTQPEHADPRVPPRHYGTTDPRRPPPCSRAAPRGHPVAAERPDLPTAPNHHDTTTARPAVPTTCRDINTRQPPTNARWRFGPQPCGRHHDHHTTRPSTIRRYSPTTDQPN